MKIKITPNFKLTKIRLTTTLSLVPRISKRPINIAIQNAGRLIIPPCDGVVVIEVGKFIPPC